MKNFHHVPSSTSASPTSVLFSSSVQKHNNNKFSGNLTPQIPSNNPNFAPLPPSKIPFLAAVVSTDNTKTFVAQPATTTKNNIIQSTIPPVVKNKNFVQNNMNKPIPSAPMRGNSAIPSRKRGNFARFVGMRGRSRGRGQDRNQKGQKTGKGKFRKKSMLASLLFFVFF